MIFKIFYDFQEKDVTVSHGMKEVDKVLRDMNMRKISYSRDKGDQQTTRKLILNVPQEDRNTRKLE